MKSLQNSFCINCFFSVFQADSVKGTLESPGVAQLWEMPLEPRNRHQGSELPRSLPHEIGQLKVKKNTVKNGVKRPAAVLKRPAKK